jgi:integrase
VKAKTRSAAQAQIAKLLSSMEREIAASSVTMDVLLREWMMFQSSRGRSPTTLHGYQSIIDLYVSPKLGAKQISLITTHNLDSLYSWCSREGKSPRTVRNIHTVISASLSQAVRWGWVTTNPAQRATLPEAQPRKIVAPSQDEVRNLIEACQEMDELLGAFVFLSAVTGCRRGEVAALRWNSFDGERLIIRESAFQLRGEQGIKSTKSGRERYAYLDPVIQTWLERWRSRCSAQANEWGVRLEPHAFIFSSRPDGSTMVRMDALSHRVQKVARSIGAPHIHLHSLRHFAATELMAAGVNARVTADILGHADPAMTLRVYAHASVERQRAASQFLAQAIAPPDD